MAQATVTITYDDPLSACDSDQHSQWMYGTISVSPAASTYATGGLGTATSGPINWVVGDFPKVGNPVPLDVSLYSGATAGTTVGGFGYTWNKANNKFQITASSGTQTAGTGTVSQELTNGTAIPAAVSNDTIRFAARFRKSI
jgi:hypothetical protein